LLKSQSLVEAAAAAEEEEVEVEECDSRALIFHIEIVL
jgi:hypothetical protein